MPVIKTNDIELYYEQHGEGPPLACVQGLGVHIGYWASLVAPLSARHQMLVFDNRGAGRSAAPPGPYTVEQMAADLLGLLDALELQKVDLLGHSMGGFVSMHLAAHHPERVRKLVLYSTCPSIYWPAARFLESIEHVWRACPDISSGALTRIFTPWNWSPKMLADEAQLEMLVQLADANPYKMTYASYCAQLAACRQFQGDALLGRIQAPTLVIGGETDLIVPPAMLKLLVQCIPDVRHEMSWAGHNTHLEDPGWFAEKVLAFTADA